MKLIDMGTVFFTRGLNEKVATDSNFAKFAHDSILSHHIGDWGDIPEEDKQLNDEADLEQGDRLVSAYYYGEKKLENKILIITENYNGYQGYNHVTTVMLAEEY